MKSIKNISLKKILLALLGLLGVAILITIWLGLSVNKYHPSRDARRVSDAKFIQSILEANYNEEIGYPRSINGFLGDGEDVIPTDPQGNSYHYEIIDDGFGYRLGICLDFDDYSTSQENCPSSLRGTCKNYLCVTDRD